MNDAMAPSRASFAHTHPALRKDNPLYHAAGQITGKFETSRCEVHVRDLEGQRLSEAERRRSAEDNKMKRWDRPQHLMKPPMRMRLAIDGAAFSRAWADQYISATRKRAKLTPEPEKTRERGITGDFRSKARARQRGR